MRIKFRVKKTGNIFIPSKVKLDENGKIVMCYINQNAAYKCENIELIIED